MDPSFGKPTKWWNKLISGKNFDGIECFVILYIPFVPLKPIHAFNWQGTAYQRIPLRWSASLVAKTFLRRWIWLIVAGILLYLSSAVPDLWFAVSCPVLILGALFLLPFLDKRDQNIRWLLGPHKYGTSDPATWVDETVKAMPPAKELYKKNTYAEAVPSFLSMGQYSEAMWAARLSAAAENRPEGEKLTDTILQDPHVQEALEKVKKDPSNWKTLMGVKR